jgi:DNA repair protein RadD
MNLRDYQRDAIDGVYEWFDQSQGNPLVVVPTGGGKSVIASELIREIIEAWPTERLMVVTHVKELIEQNHNALLRGWPQAPAGIYSAGLKRRDTRAQILFCGVQSVFRRAEELGHFDLVIIDEAHLIPPKGWGMYQQLLAGLKDINSQVKLIGLTATPYRTDTGSLDKGDNRLFHGTAYECSIPQMIADGWLSAVTNRGVRSEIDTSAVKLRGGEFRADELEEAATVDGLVERSVDELLERAHDRKAWLIFCCGIDHAQQVCTELDRRGVVNTCVFGDTPADDRDTRIAAYKAGEITAMVNVNVLTTGFDAPHVDLIALMRPTQSPGLYVQMVGRGLRIAPGKEGCLVLDFGCNVLRHGPIDQVRPSQPSKGTGDAPMKKCPECMALVFTATTTCPECGHEFEIERGRPDHDESPDEESDILSGSRFERWDVSATYCERHTKIGKPDSMKVTYLAQFARQRHVSEWICFEHTGYARRKAEKWWRDRLGKEPVPETVSEALARVELGEILETVAITVDTSGKYAEIKGRRLDDPDTAAWKADAADDAAHPSDPFEGVDLDSIPF